MADKRIKIFPQSLCFSSWSPSVSNPYKGDAAILCTAKACLHHRREKSEREKGKLFISAEAFFATVGGKWKFDEKIGVICLREVHGNYKKRTRAENILSALKALK